MWGGNTNGMWDQKDKKEKQIKRKAIGKMGMKERREKAQHPQPKTGGFFLNQKNCKGILQDLGNFKVVWCISKTTQNSQTFTFSTLRCDI